MGDFPFHMIPRDRIAEDARPYMMEGALNASGLVARQAELDDLEAEFNQVMAIEAEVVPQLTALGTQAALSAKNSLRATGIEGVYTRNRRRP